ncbi:phenylalanine--tRNA ligase subunit beta [bacterium]|nr:phenylalanine--tRNA ligase subunit beta [bacterium]
MKISLNWLQDYVDVEDLNDLPRLLTSAGMEVEGVKRVGDGVKGVVTAKVLGVEAHPDADKLRVCRVDTGAGEHTVVCGAPNVAEGQIIALAAPGCTLPVGKIEKKAVRGVESHGMIASKRELGVSDDHSGIWVLPPDTPIGEMLDMVVPLGDVVIEVDITANRPDLLCMLGIAREVAAYTGQKLRRPEIGTYPKGGAVDGKISVDIQDPDACRRYSAFMVQGVRVEPSPMYMQLRLDAVGVRPINNLVDVTNYVLFELNQPLHAFDYEFLQGQKIVVRQAKDGETMTTLDEKERSLTSEDLLICDGEKPVALAGVMGGANSEVSAKTSTVLIESAYFSPVGVRRTSKRLGLASDSSYRFERGIDIDGVVNAAARAAELMARDGHGAVVDGYVDNFPNPREEQVIRLRGARCNHVLGTGISTPHMARLLEKIELGIVDQNDDHIDVRVPNFRADDITREIDLIEEVARLQGFDDIAPTIPATAVQEHIPDPVIALIDKARDAMVGLGYGEAPAVAMTSREMLDAFKDAPGRYVELLNPLSAEMGILRDSLLPTMLTAVSRNLARQNRDLAIFEVRRVFLPSEQGELPHEPTHVAFTLAGRAEPAEWSSSDRTVDFFDAKGTAEEFLEAVGVLSGVEFQAESAPSFYIDGAGAEIAVNGRPVGHLGRFSPTLLAKFDIDAEVYGGQIDLTALIPHLAETKTFKPWSRFPRTTRDLAVLVDQTQPVGPLREAISAVDETHILAVRVFDIYTGKGVESGKKSVAFSLDIQSMESTMTVEDTDRIVERVVEKLSTAFGAKLR